MFKTQQKRNLFFYALGKFYAGLGGTFGAYREASPAFTEASFSHLYRKVKFTQYDFLQFEEGFNEMQELRKKMQLAKVKAQEEIMEALEGSNLTGTVVKDYKNVRELIAAQELDS